MRHSAGSLTLSRFFYVVISVEMGLLTVLSNKVIFTVFNLGLNILTNIICRHDLVLNIPSERFLN